MNFRASSSQTFALSMAIFVSTCAGTARAQTLDIREAVDTGLKNFQSIPAKRNYLNASTSLAQNTRNEYLPNVIISMQQGYGTVNGQFGPLGAVGIAGAGGGLAVASSGPVSASQNWNSAFGALYLTAVNWEFFSFGRVRSKIRMSDSQVTRDSADLLQEQFIHQVRVSGAYLNLLTAQRLLRVAESDLLRTAYVQSSVKARTLGGLNPGVDSSQANSELSRAKLALIAARTNEQQVRNVFAQYLNRAPDPFILDTTFFHRLPGEFNTPADLKLNPQVLYYRKRLEYSDQTTTFLKRSFLPGFNFFSVVQTRGSGFDYNYTSDYPDRFSKSYSAGIKPTRTNYLLGVSLSWNIMSIPKIHQQVNAQRFVSAAYKNEYDLIETQLRDQLILADQRIENAVESVREVPFQYQAAREAYLQKSVLYKNGLTTLVDLQQALYALNRAEADLGLAYINVWNALLQKAAASGDFSLFLNQAAQP